MKTPMANKEVDDALIVRFRKMWLPVRVVYARPRTFASVAVGTVAFFLLPDSSRLVTRLLISWDIFASLYLVLAYIMMFRCGLAHKARNHCFKANDEQRQVKLASQCLCRHRLA